MSKFWNMFKAYAANQEPKLEPLVQEEAPIPMDPDSVLEIDEDCAILISLKKDTQVEVIVIMRDDSTKTLPTNIGILLSMLNNGSLSPHLMQAINKNEMESPAYITTLFQSWADSEVDLANQPLVPASEVLNRKPE